MTRTIKTRIALPAALALASLLVVPAVARAAVIMTFDQFEQGGTLTDLGGGDFKGTNIIFEYITVSGSGLTAWCGSTVVSFTNVPGGGTNTNCLLNFNTSTGTFVLTAPSGLYDSTGIGGLPGGLIGGTTGTILTGTGFSSFGLNADNEFGAEGTDSKNQFLLNYFGIGPVAFSFNNTEIFTDPDGNVTQADLTNTEVEETVPEPGLLALFGLGLLGVGRKLVVMARR